MFRRNPFSLAVVTAVVLSMLAGFFPAPAFASAVSRNLLFNSEFRESGAGWALGEYGTVDAKVTREGYPSVKLSVSKAKQPVDACVKQALPEGSWAVGDALTLSAYLARAKTSAFTKKTLPALALYAVVNGEVQTFGAEIKKLKDIKEAGTKNKSSAWSRFSVTMTVPEGAAEVGCVLALPQNGTVYMAQPWLTRGNETTDWYPDAGHKEVSKDGAVTVGTTGGEGFLLTLPAGAYEGEEGIAVSVEGAEDIPAMPHAQALGQAIVAETGGPVRLEETAKFTYAYDPAVAPDPLLVCLGYFDGEEWSYIPAESVDTEAHTLTFPIHHFSTYYPAQFKSELDAAKHYAGQFAARKVLGDGGGDAKTASRSVAELIAGKLGLGESEFATRMIADIAADQDVIKVVEECRQEGWSNTGYEKVMSYLCDKISDRLVENRTGLTAEDGAKLTGGEQAFKDIGDMIKVTDSGSKLLAYIAEGDSGAAASELFNFATDNTGAAGKALKYTLQGMQNALDVWRDGEVEKAYEVYVNGSPGSLFGYGLIDPKDFDAVWDGMKGASRQLCIERIAAENNARELIGMPALTAKEEDFFREKVKQELKGEFERRVTLQGKIDQEKENLDLIFEELDKADLLDSSKVWYRGFGGAGETLESRMARMEHLIQRIYRDLEIENVYGGPQMTEELNGRISASAMAAMVRGYFAADTQAEAEQFLREYYRKFGVSLAPTAEELAGTYSITMTVWGQTPTGTCEITVSGQTAQFELGDAVWAGTYSDGILKGHLQTDQHQEGHTFHLGMDGDFMFQFTRLNGTITGSGAWSGAFVGPTNSSQATIPFDFVKLD